MFLRDGLRQSRISCAGLAADAQTCRPYRGDAAGVARALAATSARQLHALVRRQPQHQGYRRGAGPSGTNRPRRFRYRAITLSSASMSHESRSARSTRPSGRVSSTSVNTMTPPPQSPASGVPSRRTSHQHSCRLCSGTEASRRPASSSASGRSASSWRRSSVATTRAAQRQNLQPPE
jgi:hypothetical protein